MRTLPRQDIVTYWYLTVLVLLINVVITVVLVTVIGLKYSGTDTMPLAWIANIFVYWALIRGLMNTRRKPLTKRLRTLGAVLGTGLGVAMLAVGALVGGSWLTLWLITKFG
jgi:hypothetical protein